MAKKSDLFLRPRRDTAQHFAGVLTEGSEGMGVKRIKKKKKKANKVFWKGGRRMEKICEPRGCRAAGYTL